MKAWLETSAVISLHFRNRANREACLSVIPQGAEPTFSRYVIFELARGFLSRLRRFHNDSIPCTKWHELRALVKKGRNEYTYEGKCWRDALDDIEEALETGEDSKERGLSWMAPEKALAFFRSRLRCVILEGWDCCCQDYPPRESSWLPD